MVHERALLAEKMVNTFLLDPGESILEIEEGRSRVAVTTSDRGWIVEPLKDAGQFHRSQGYTLYDLRDADMDGASRSHGVAVLPDGEMFHLNDPAGLDDFFAVQRPALDALEIAALVVFYQSTMPAVEQMVWDFDDLRWLFPGSQIEAIPALALPVVEGVPAADLHLQCCTFFLADDPADHVTKVNLNRWHIDLADSGTLSWQCEPLARNLDSPRFRG